jgi:hypothetical protein
LFFPIVNKAIKKPRHAAAKADMAGRCVLNRQKLKSIWKLPGRIYTLKPSIGQKGPAPLKAKGWIPKKEEQEKDDSPDPLYYLVEIPIAWFSFCVKLSLLTKIINYDRISYLQIVY